MDRRSFIQTSLATTSGIAVAGCLGGTDDAPNGGDSPFPSYGHPPYGAWIPASSQDDSEGVMFTHLNVSSDGFNNSSESGSFGGGSASSPLIDLPATGGIVTAFGLFGLFGYPFADAIAPGQEDSADGFSTDAMTLCEGVVVFHGSYDPEIIESEYTDGFEVTGTKGSFTMYEGLPSDEREGSGFMRTEGMAFAVSDDALAVGMGSGEEAEHEPRELLHSAVDANIADIPRAIDDAEGDWLFDATGTPDMAFGVWDFAEWSSVTEDLNEEDAGGDSSGDDLAPDVQGNPVITSATSLVSTLSISTDDDGKIEQMDSRFAATFDGDTPDEASVEENLVKNDQLAADVTIEGNRLHVEATATEDMFTESSDG